MRKLCVFFLVFLSMTCCVSAYTVHEPVCLRGGENWKWEICPDQLEALKATAYSFYDRGEGVQYDNSNMTIFNDFKRDEKFFSPEEASSYSKEYTVCSSYVYKVFYNTFSKNGINYKINQVNHTDDARPEKLDTLFTKSESFVNYSNPNSDKYFDDEIAIYYIDSNTYYKNDGGEISQYHYEKNEKTGDVIEEKIGKGAPDEIVAGIQEGERPTCVIKEDDGPCEYDMVKNDNGTYSMGAKVSVLRDDIMSVLQPGDVITYYSSKHNSSIYDNDAGGYVRYINNPNTTSYGHVILYLGDDTILESQSNLNPPTYQFGKALGGITSSSLSGVDAMERPTTALTNKDGRNLEGSIKQFYLRRNGSGDSVFGSGSRQEIRNYKNPNDISEGFENVKDESGNNLKRFFGNRAFDETVEAISIVRPIREVNKDGYTIQESAKTRTDLERLTVTKTASVGRYDVVNPGESIKYTISLKNRDEGMSTDSFTSHDYNVIVEDKLEEGLKFDNVPSNCELTNNDQVMTCTYNKLPLGKDSEERLEYWVKVDKRRKDYIISDKTMVYGFDENGNRDGGYKLTTIKTRIGNTLVGQVKDEADEVIGLSDYLDSQIKNNNSNICDNNTCSVWSFVDGVYKKYYGISDSFSISSIFSNFIKRKEMHIYAKSIKDSVLACKDTSALAVYYTIENDSNNCTNKNENGKCVDEYCKTFIQIREREKLLNGSTYQTYYTYELHPEEDRDFSKIFTGLYGGVFTKNLTNNTLDRPTYIELDDLRVGDLIITGYQDRYIAYIYAGEKRLFYYNSSTKKIESSKNVSDSGAELFGAENILQTLVGKDFFIVLRPSLINDDWVYINEPPIGEDPIEIAKPVEPDFCYVYNGNEITLDVPGFDSETMVAFNNKATDAGIYEVSIKPRADYVWDDGTRDTLNYSVEICKASLHFVDNSKDVEVMYDGRQHTIETNFSYDSQAKIRYMDTNGEYTLSSIPKYTDVGVYVVKYKAYIDNNYGEYYGERTLTIKAIPKITFYANDGSDNSVIQELEEFDNVTLMKNSFRRNEYRFIGWNTESDGSGTSYNDEDVINVSEDVILYAMWEYDPNVVAYEKGDVDRNGSIQLNDVLLLIRKYLGIENIEDVDYMTGDMDDNESINVKDVIILIRVYLGIE